MNFRIAFSRSRISKATIACLLAGFFPVVVAPQANAVAACVLNTDYIKDTSSVAGYTILKFTRAGSCSFRNTDAITSFEYLIVGGGGGGGAHVGGGGGGGGVLTGNSTMAGLGAIPITVGAGGTGAWITQSAWQTYGSNGGNSSLNGVTAYGGGVGGIWQTYAPGYVSGSVGSAGGSGYSYNWGGGTSSQGKSGGTGFDVQPHAAGGGGGAGQVGGNASQTSSGNGTGGKGGDGIASSITGTSTYYGGGGGGGVHGNNNAGVYTGGAGGLGGGGAGSSHSGNYNVTPRQPANYGTSGTANTGGGGGGSGGGMWYVENKAGNGGSGIIVIKYLTTSTRANDVDYDMNLASSGNYGYLSIAGSDLIQPSSSEAFSMEAWVRPTSTCAGTRCTIFSREGQMRLTILNGKISFILYNTNAWGSWTDLTTGDIPINSWSHLAITRNGTAIKLFLNGNQIASYTQSYAPLASNTTYPFYVGIVYGGPERFYGAIDEVKIWKSDRSANITTDMHTNDASSTNLAAYWNFNEGSGSTAYNLTSNANTETELILTSSTLWNSSLISDSTVSGPYTTVNFYRTYITGNGGWKVPSGVTALTSIVVAGGGGGGAESDDTGWFGGGGGGGGYRNSSFSGLNQNTVQVQVGAGGRGGQQVSRSASSDTLPTNGQNSIFYSLTSTGGGAGGVSYTSGLINGSIGGSGGGGATYSGTGAVGTAGQGNSGGSSPGTCCAGGGGGGAGSAGGNGAAASAAASVGGAAGNGVLNSMYVSGYSLQYLAAGGAGGSYTTAGNAGSQGGTAAWTSATANSGSGGGGGGSSATNPDKPGGAGGSGIVIVRWITASVPSYTKPTNAYLNVGMTESFTVNVSSDSATSVLTRTFKWESSTAGSSGPWRTLKEGTGASNASISWVPTDTSTSGSNYLYRLTVTDSDTAGLYISDSSTAYAVINLALGFSGSSTIKKTINSSKTETYTVTNGTPTYRYALSPTTTGITIDSTTAGYPRILLSDTLTVGTYLETLTVTDSVSATYSLPLTITVSGPPTLSNAAEVVTNGQIFQIDSGNSASYTPGTTATGTTSIRDISGSGHTVTVNGSALTYSDDYGGILSTGSSNYLQFTKRKTLTSWTVEGYIRINSALSSTSCIVTNQYTGYDMNFSLCVDTGRTFFAGFHKSGWTYKRTSVVLSLGSWYHVVATYDLNSTDTNKVQIYLNGETVAISDSAVNGGSTPPAGDTNFVYIGREFYSNYFVPMSIGAVRIYDLPLTQTQVRQNYNATRNRFTSDNLNQTKLSQKHNTSTIETFTVTSGGETKTVTFAVGNRTGVEWTTPDTSTVKLSVTPALVVGTYYDTITVTDNFSASTILPVKITISKGDQAKITIGQYNAYPGVSTYPINVYGGSGTGAVTRTLTSAGTAGCSLASGMYLTAARVGSCTVQAVKATDANFLAETGTATIYWIQWSDAYATRAPSTPTEIVLNHQTAITKYNFETLTVTSYQNSSGVTITTIATGAVLRIIGDGFSPTAAYTEAVFASMDSLDLTTGLSVVSNGAGGYYLQLTVPSGVTSGAITVNSPKGTAVGPSLTITP